MGWTRTTDRGAHARRRPDLENLETRRLLSTAQPTPAASALTYAGGDGSVAFDRVIEASAARAKFGVDGTGQTVAVIDTGVDYRNATLGGAVGPGHKVVAGVDFTGAAGGVLPTWQHGTGVAGLIAANGPAYKGVAPSADVVALRVFGSDNQGSFNDIAKALEWVAQHHSEFKITAVNLSVSDGGNYASNIFAQDGGVGQEITDDVRTLDNLNIPVVVAAGNSYNGKDQGQGFASIIPDTISVTGTDESRLTATKPNDQLASNAQRLGGDKGRTSATKIAAPGVGITALAGDGGTTTEDGTSFAAPQVTGTVVLLQQMYQDAYHKLPTVAQLDSFLQAGAVVVHDGMTGINIGRLDTLRSLTLLDDQIRADAASASASVAVRATSSPIVTAAATGPVAISTAAISAPSVITKASDSTGAPKGPTTEAPTTEVFLNGTSLGSYPTSQLAKRYSSLLSLQKGPAKTLRIWAPMDSPVDLGATTPIAASSMSSVADSRVRLAAARVAKSPGAKVPMKVDTSHSVKVAAGHCPVAATPVHLGHHAAKHKKFGLFSSSFPFLF